MTLSKKAIHAPECLNEPVTYGKSFSRGVRVDVGNATMLFISGTASVDETGKSCHRGDFKAQAQRTFDNITALLSSEGATWDNVIQTRCYLKDMERDYLQFNECRNAYYQRLELDPFPASVCIQATLCRPELLVEIEAVAIIPRTG